MKDGISFYFGICVLALLLKYIIGKLNDFFGKDKKQINHEHHSIEEHNHEEEHFIAHLIKYFLLILFAILAYKLINGSFSHSFS